MGDGERAAAVLEGYVGDDMARAQRLHLRHGATGSCPQAFARVVGGKLRDRRRHAARRLMRSALMLVPVVLAWLGGAWLAGYGAQPVPGDAVRFTAAGIRWGGSNAGLAALALAIGSLPVMLTASLLLKRALVMFRGEPAYGTVVSCRFLRASDDDAGVGLYAVSLWVHLEGRPPARVDHEVWLDDDESAALRPGHTLQLVALPHRPERYEIVPS